MREFWRKYATGSPHDGSVRAGEVRLVDGAVTFSAISQ